MLPPVRRLAVHRPALLPAVVAVAVALPLVSLTLRGDERHKIYLFGTRHVDDLVGVLTYPFSTIGMFLELGNYRPLGRLVEIAAYQLVYEVSGATATPAHVVNGVLRLATIAAFVAVAGWFAGRLLTTVGLEAWPGRAVAGMLAAVSMVGAGEGGVLVVYSGLYLASTALVILLAGLFVATPGIEALTGSRAQRRYLVAAFVGAATVSFNELTHLTLPLAGVTAVATVLAQPGTARTWVARLLRSVTLRTYAAFVAGAAAVAVPVRLLIARLCGADGTCYAGSNLTFEGWSVGALVSRLGSGVPFVAWQAVDGADAPSLTPFLVLTIALVAVVTAAATGAALWSAPRTSYLRAGTVLAVVGLGLAVPGALMASLSETVQAGVPLGEGWRETASVVGGLAITATGGVLALIGALRDRTSALGATCVALALVVGLTAAGTTRANVVRATTEALDAEARATNALAASLVDIDTTSAGDERRCAILADVAERYGTLPRDGVLSSVDAITQARAGVPYCSSDPAGTP